MSIAASDAMGADALPAWITRRPAGGALDNLALDNLALDNFALDNFALDNFALDNFAREAA